MYLILDIVIVLLVIGSIYSIIRLYTLSTRIDRLTENVSSIADSLASTTKELQATIAKTNTSLSTALSDQQKNVSAVQQQLGGFKSQVGDLSGSLNTLQKLAKTDPELLKKYSKVYFLNDNYVPARLAEIPLTYQYSENKQLIFHTDALPRLKSMLDAAKADAVNLYVSSAYRSFAEQKALKSDYAMTYGAGTANSFSADQGYSEHQLGTAVDVITSGLGGVLDEKFDTTKAYQWMQKNAYKYGFILSYPKNNAYYVYEPWHWRFVGVKLAARIHEDGKNFYDLEQRTIDGYLVNIFD